MNQKFICPKCEKYFTSQYKLNRHLNRKNPCDKDKTQCQYCGNYFYDVSTKRRHELLNCSKHTQSKSQS